MSAETLNMHFSIEASGLVEIARARVMEEAWEHGVRILRCLETDNGPMSFDDCYAVLSGVKTLVGDETGVYIMDETPAMHARIKAEQAYYYGNRFKERKGWWALYGQVTGYWSKQDMSWAFANQEAGRRVINAGGRALSDPYGRRGVRPLFYANEPMTDLLIYSPQERGETRMFFARASESPPPWMTATGDAWNVDRVLRDVDLSTLDKIEARNWEMPSIRERQRDIDVRGDDIHAELRQATRSGQGIDVQAAIDLAGDQARLERQKKEHLRWMEYQDECRRLRDAVRKQAGPRDGAGWFTLAARDGSRKWAVPYAPFVVWLEECTRRVGDVSIGLPVVVWRTVSPVGMKLSGDIPEHTDWMLGSILIERDGKPVAVDVDLEDDYRGQDTSLMDAANTRSFQMRHAGEDVAWFAAQRYDVLVNAGMVVGTVVHPTVDGPVPKGSIVILPNASTDWTVTALSAEGVIVEVGGALAHLSVVGRERGFPLLRIPGARGIWPEGTRLMIDSVQGTVTIFGGTP